MCMNFGFITHVRAKEWYDFTNVKISFRADPARPESIEFRMRTNSQYPNTIISYRVLKILHKKLLVQAPQAFSAYGFESLIFC